MSCTRSSLSLGGEGGLIGGVRIKQIFAAVQVPTPAAHSPPGPTYLTGVENGGVARARRPPGSEEEGRAGRPRDPDADAEFFGPVAAQAPPAQRCPQPRLGPADCGHVTPPANREGPGRRAFRGTTNTRPHS